MSKEYESKTEHKENLIDIAGLFDDLIKGIIQMKWRFLIILVICGAVFCGYKRLTYSPYYVASSHLRSIPVLHQRIPIHILRMQQPTKWQNHFRIF